MIHNITYTPTHRITCMYIAGFSVIASIYQVYKYISILKNQLNLACAKHCGVGVPLRG